jgi:hypothetical protein
MWDLFVVPPEFLGGSVIPQGWAQPSEPASQEWSHFIV